MLIGHAFGSGFALALCHDYRVMQMTRGWLCFNEVLLGIRFAPYFPNFLRWIILPGLKQTNKTKKKDFKKLLHIEGQMTVIV